jgi:peptidoglycan/LPS O-acetylase OafA/YrhL
LATDETARTTLRHLPALDGLRGLAVLGVLSFHANAALAGGYLGVDLFFVLSGYLITSLLLAEHAESGRIALSTFWVRRARRLFPALLSLMPAVALYARFLAKPDELAKLRGDALATLGYFANWRAVFQGQSYWEIFAAPSPFEHTWSLAIEEQFYVVWPLLFVLLVVRLRLSKAALLAITLSLAALSAASLVVLYDGANTSRAYFGTDTRATAILVGGALAMVLAPGDAIAPATARGLDVLGFIALAGLALAWWKLDGENPFLYRGGLWLAQLAALALVACSVAGPRSIVARLLSFRPLALCGTVSYGLYLWHWPINVVLTPERVHVGPLALNAIRVLATFLVAAASYRFLERPIRRRGLPFGRPILIVPASVAVCLLLVVRATYARKPPSGPPSLPAPATQQTERSWRNAYDVDQRTLPPANELRPGTLRVLFLGDSIATSLGVALRHQQDAFVANCHDAGSCGHVFVAERGVGHCGVLSGLVTARFVDKPIGGGTNCAEHWTDDVAELRPDVTVIALGGGYFSSIDLDGTRQTACDRGWREVFRARMLLLLDALENTAGRIALTLVPYPMDRWRYKTIVERVACYDRELAEIAALRGVATIDLMEHTCPTVECRLLSNGDPIRPDGLHFDGPGAHETAQWFLKEIHRVRSLVVTPPAGPSPEKSADIGEAGTPPARLE